MNRPKEPPLSPFERDQLTQRLAVEYADAIVAQALAQGRVRGIRSLALMKLGTAGFHEIEAGLEMATPKGDALPVDVDAETNEAGSPLSKRFVPGPSSEIPKTGRSAKDSR